MTSASGARRAAARQFDPPGLFRGDFCCWFSLLLCTLVFAGCGAPAPRVKVLETPPDSGLRGTQKPYEIDGVRYEPLLAAEGFVEMGIASWYGPGFHGKKTSNGETYNMHGMTAAHKTLPMNVFVRVVNLDNNLETTVRINDRGPFVAGRIIDLSQAAAQELKVIGPGTARVKVEALGYREVRASDGAVTYRPAVSYVPGPFTVQVGSFAVEANARRLAAQLQERYGEASVVEGWVDGKKFHRVRAGLYKTMVEAERARAGFEKGEFPRCFVVAKD
jgi:rare lipoprotein A